VSPVEASTPPGPMDRQRRRCGNSAVTRSTGARGTFEVAAGPRKSCKTASIPLSSATVRAQEQEATTATLSLLAELLTGFRRPAAFGTEQGVVLCMNSEAMKQLEQEPGAKDDGGPAGWPRRITLQIEGQSFHLLMPDRAPTAIKLPHLPPRLAKIARMVIAGSTDKQIAHHTGLSFSTVRTYVRQIYRRMGVNSRVALVHAMSA
jgi:DNA-binding CsgD family transcriptional regulator